MTDKVYRSSTKRGISVLIDLVRYKQFYIPYDEVSYKTLVDLGFPATRIHEDLLPSLQLVTKKHGVRAKAKEFRKDVLEPYFDHVAEVWRRAPAFKAKLATKEMVFWTLDAKSEERAKKALPKLEASLLKFFERWGFGSELIFSESRGKVKLTVKFFFSSIKKPVVPLEAPAEEKPYTIFQMGHHRLMVSNDSKWFTWKIEVKCGDEWRHQTGSRCLLTDLTDPKDMIGALMSAVNEAS